jgi:hypothetical protein
MHAPTPSFVRAHEYRRQDLLAAAARSRLVRSATQNESTGCARPKRSPAVTTVCVLAAHARYALTSLASVAFVGSLN